MAEAIAQSDRPIDIRECFDSNTGLLNRRIFADEAIYQQELRRIFGRAWNFMCHETQLPEPGSFFTNYIGEDEVIVVRDRQQRINVLLNSCPHRGYGMSCRARHDEELSLLLPWLELRPRRQADRHAGRKGLLPQ